MLFRRSKPAAPRPARPVDGPAILAVHVAALRSLCEGDYAGTGLWEWATGLTAGGYAAAIARNHFLVAECGGQVVGFANFDAMCGEIIALYVHPAHTCRGTGTRLLKAVERHAEAQGVRGLSLLAALPAVPFYERFGFIAEEPESHDPGHGIAVPCVPMSKN